MSPILLHFWQMIEKEQIELLVNKFLEGTDKFIMDIKVTSGNLIVVTIDGDKLVTIDDCISLSKAIEKSLDRDVEDFELRVTSYGADSPLKIIRQYTKHIGRELDVTKADDSKVQGKLIEVKENCIVLEEIPLKKNRPLINTIKTLDVNDIKEARIVLSFK